MQYVEGWSGASAEILDAEDNVLENVQLVAPPPTTKLLKPDMLDGRWLLPDEGQALVLSDSIWSALPDLKAGESYAGIIIDDNGSMHHVILLAGDADEVIAPVAAGRDLGGSCDVVAAAHRSVQRRRVEATDGADAPPAQSPPAVPHAECGETTRAAPCAVLTSGT